MIWAALWQNQIFAYAKTKTQISFAVTAKLISAFVFATRIVQSLFYLCRKFQASSHLLWLLRLVCVKPGLKPRRQVFLCHGSYVRAMHTPVLLYSKIGMYMKGCTLFYFVLKHRLWVLERSTSTSTMYPQSMFPEKIIKKKKGKKFFTGQNTSV